MKIIPEYFWDYYIYLFTHPENIRKFRLKFYRGWNQMMDKML